MIVDEAARDRAFGDDQSERVERAICRSSSPAKRAVGERRIVGDALLRIGGRHRAMAEHLAVGEIVAGAAPGIEQPGALAGLLVEQPACEAERLRAARDDPLGRAPTRIARSARARSSIINPAVALALPTTPGMPAPGWVPAPTK